MATVVHGDFEWEEQKAAQNRRKHGVSFAEAALAMRDAQALDFDDVTVPQNIVTLAASPRGAIPYVVSTQRGERIRIISARTATSHERRLYEEGE